MNDVQRLYWQQASSDWKVYRHLAEQSFPVCHEVQHLQMASEKIAKAWMAGSAVPRTVHTGLLHFLRSIGSRHFRERIGRILGYDTSRKIEAVLREMVPIAYELEGLSPAVARQREQDENCEYPWPAENPLYTPATTALSIEPALRGTSGRSFIRNVGLLIERFEQYADL